MPPQPPRFLERFWSLYLVGQMGATHTIGYSVLGLLRLVGVGLIGIGLLVGLVWLSPEMAGMLIGIALTVAVLVIVFQLMWGLVAWMFR